jgi:hypothetical protein
MPNSNYNPKTAQGDVPVAVDPVVKIPTAEDSVIVTADGIEWDHGITPPDGSKAIDIDNNGYIDVINRSGTLEYYGNNVSNQDIKATLVLENNVLLGKNNLGEYAPVKWDGTMDSDGNNPSAAIKFDKSTQKTATVSSTPVAVTDSQKKEKKLLKKNAALLGNQDQKTVATPEAQQKALENAASLVIRNPQNW